MCLVISVDAVITKEVMTMFDTLAYYFQFPFVRYALIVGVLTALSAALLGVILVLKRFSYIGDGLSHMAFGVIALASVLKVADNYLVLPATIICAVLLLRAGPNSKVKGDAALAMMSVSSLAIGYMLLNKFGNSANLSGDVCSTLFGSTSILTIKMSEVIMCLILTIVVVAFFVIFYRKIFAVTFDEDFARAVGVNVDFYNTLIAVIIAVVIVMAMNLVGSLLISALVVFPALSSMRLFKNFKMVTISSAVIGVVGALVGIIVAILAGTPVGASIVTVDIVIYLLCLMVGAVKR